MSIYSINLVSRRYFDTPSIKTVNYCDCVSHLMSSGSSYRSAATFWGRNTVQRRRVSPSVRPSEDCVSVCLSVPYVFLTQKQKKRIEKPE